MAVNRVWFANIPSGTIDELQRSQVAIGYPFPVQAAVVDPLNQYIRRYLNDTITVTPNTPYATPAAPPTYDELTYLKRYLNNG